MSSFGHHLDHQDEDAGDGGRHGHQASLADGLDFVNTLEQQRGGVWVDHLDSLKAAIRWLAEHDLLHREMVLAQMKGNRDPSARERTLARVREVRQALRELLDARVERRPADPSALRTVNRALRTHYVIEL